MIRDFLLSFSKTLLPKFSVTLPSILVLLGILLLSFACGKSLERQIKHFIEQQGHFFNKNLTLRYIRLIPVTLMTLALSLIDLLSREVFHLENEMFFYAQNILIMCLTAQLILILFKRITAVWLIILLVVPLGILLNQQLWDDVALALNRWTFQIGSLKISLYQIFKSFFVAIAFYWGVRKILNTAESNIDKISFIRPSLRALAIKFLQIILYIIFALWLLSIIGVPLTSLTVFSGAIGIGIGFGVQRIVANFISGIIILMEETLKQDDIVELEDGGFGSIKKTHARYTLVETFDGKEIFIPNEEFITKRVTNWTYSHKRARQSIMISVSYDSDLLLAQKLMLEAVTEHRGIAKSPAPYCYLMGFGDSAVNFLLRFWFSRIDFNIYKPRSELLFTIWHKFKAAGIKLPYPQQDVHIRTIPEQVVEQPLGKRRY